MNTCRDCQQVINWDNKAREKLNTRRPLNSDGTIHSCNIGSRKASKPIPEPNDYPNPITTSAATSKVAQLDLNNLNVIKIITAAPARIHHYQGARTMTRIDKEIAILLVSFFALVLVATAMTANSKQIISAINSTAAYQTPMEKLISNIPNGCMFENKTDVSPSPINGGIDHIIVIRCLE